MPAHNLVSKWNLSFQSARRWCEKFVPCGRHRVSTPCYGPLFATALRQGFHGTRHPSLIPYCCTAVPAKAAGILTTPYRSAQRLLCLLLGMVCVYIVSRWDCWETDRRNRTALFWAAGGGSIEACKALVEGEGGLRPQDAGGDGSTPLHWAAAGVEVQRFGTGGHVDVSTPAYFPGSRSGN